MPITALAQKLETAFTLQQANRVADAMTVFQEILNAQPDQPDALHGLGLCYAQQKQFDQAIFYMKQAIAQAPEVPGFHNNIGNAYKRIGDLESAKRHYQEALRLKTPYADAHNNLGSIYYLQGKFAHAKEQYQKALRINPDLWDAHFNLANCYIHEEFYLEAKPHLEAVLKLRPDHIGAVNNLGMVFCILKQFDQAKPLLEQVVAREPNNAEALFHLGIANASTGALEAAKENYLAVLLLNPNHSRAHHNLATLYLHLKETEHALVHYEKACFLNPNNQTALHMIKALKGETLPEGAPLEYTRALFDQYAYSYDQHVKEKLNYQVPYLLREMIQPMSQTKTTPWKVLDLGCGTGLCAPYFIDLADKLYGVDLSPNMIDQALKLDAYYKLAVDDITHYLTNTKEQFDLIICADVFVYFGDLKQTLSQCFNVLNPNGYMLFSIERLETAACDEYYKLSATGRYQHQPLYINTLAEEIGFQLKAYQEAVLRVQEEGEVKGDLFLLQKL